MKGGKIPAELLQKIKDAVNLVDIVGEHVVLRKSGSNHSGLCPFHSERSPSFSVSEQKQLYHCYGCKRGGDLLSFVMEIHGISFPEAIEELADRARVALPKDFSSPVPGEDSEQAKNRAAARERLALAHKLNRFAAAFFHQSLAQVPHIDRYFQSRAVKGDLARSFYVGAAPARWDSLSRHLAAKKAPLALAVELGLIKPSPKDRAKSGGVGYFDLFRNRAMFPILDMRGKVAGFGGRALPLPEGAPDVGGESPKYMNSPESLTFRKSKLAFGLYQAQKHIREKDEVLVVEGYFDVTGLHSAGFGHAVSTCGTSLTPDHIQLFRRLGQKITILFDGDKAGIAATARVMEVGLEQGFVLYGAEMPEGLDPDELVLAPEGKEKMAAILAASKPMLDAQIEKLAVEARKGPEAQTQAVKQIAAWLSKFKDPVGREVRLNSVPQQLGVSRQLLERAMGGAPAPRGGELRTGPVKPAPVERPQPPQRPAKPEPLGPADRLLLVAFARGGDYAPLFAKARRDLPAEMTISDLFDQSSARAFVARVLGDASGWERFRAAPEMFLGSDLDPQVRSTLTEALVASESPVEMGDVKLALHRAVQRAWARFSQLLRRSLAEAEAKKDAGLHAKLQKDYLDVQRKIKEFNSFYDEA